MRVILRAKGMAPSSLAITLPLIVALEAGEERAEGGRLRLPATTQSLDLLLSFFDCS